MIDPIDVLRWNSIKNFKKQEFQPNADKVDLDLVILLDRFRDEIGAPVVIHCAYETTGHSKNSQHAKGKAADLHVKGVSLLEAFDAAEKIGFTGIGVYPHWNNPGLHLDIRDRKPIRWYQDENGEYIYVSSNEIRKMLSEA